MATRRRPSTRRTRSRRRSGMLPSFDDALGQPGDRPLARRAHPPRPWRCDAHRPAPPGRGRSDRVVDRNRRPVVRQPSLVAAVPAAGRRLVPGVGSRPESKLGLGPDAVRDRGRLPRADRHRPGHRQPWRRPLRQVPRVDPDALVHGSRRRRHPHRPGRDRVDDRVQRAAKRSAPPGHHDGPLVRLDGGCVDAARPDGRRQRPRRQAGRRGPARWRRAWRRGRRHRARPASGRRAATRTSRMDGSRPRCPAWARRRRRLPRPGAAASPRPRSSPIRRARFARSTTSPTRATRRRRRSGSSTSCRRSPCSRTSPTRPSPAAASPPTSATRKSSSRSWRASGSPPGSTRATPARSSPSTRSSRRSTSGSRGSRRSPTTWRWPSPPARSGSRPRSRARARSGSRSRTRTSTSSPSAGSSRRSSSRRPSRS